MLILVFISNKLYPSDLNLKLGVKLMLLPLNNRYLELPMLSSSLSSSVCQSFFLNDEIRGSLMPLLFIILIDSLLDLILIGVNWINSLLEKKLADEFKEFVLSSLRTELS
jgi:hypothetical protein